MKLTTKGRYAVMAMADLAQHEGAGPVRLADIAHRQGISPGYLEHLLARLRRAGLVRAVRGPGGGYALQTAAADTRIADIMLSAEEGLGVTRCGGAALGCLGVSRRCLTHDLWDGLGQHIHEYLNAVSLADVVAGRASAIRPGMAPDIGAAPPVPHSA